MGDEGVYKGLLDVISDELFPIVDCRLRQGEHISSEDITVFSYIREAYPFLSRFYKKYKCQLIHDTQEESDYFFLSPYEKATEKALFGRKQLSQSEMVVGMVLSYMLMDPEYISKKVPFERLVFFSKRLLGEDAFFERFAPRSRGKDSLLDEKKALAEISKCLQHLRRLGFLGLSGKNKLIIVKSPIFRFISPIRGLGNLDQNIQILLEQGLVETEEFLDDLAEDKWVDAEGIDSEVADED